MTTTEGRTELTVDAATVDAPTVDAPTVDAATAADAVPSRATRLVEVPSLNGIRGLAALAVVFAHVGFLSGRSLKADLLGPILSRGNFGVTVFFLLSGFLLYRPFAAHSFGLVGHPRTGRFFARRAARILPALWLMVTLNLAFITPRPPTAGDWSSYLLLVQTYDHHDFDNTLTQLWSLTVEVSFYALLPLLAALVGGPKRNADTVLRRHAALFAGMTAVAVIFNLLVRNQIIGHDQSLLWLPSYLDWFAGGMALAVLSCVPAGTRAFARVRAGAALWASQRGTCWLIAAVLFLIATLPVGLPRTLAVGTYWQWTTQHYLYLGAAFFVLLPLVLGRRGDSADRVLGSRVGRWFGDVSYSVYLWHPAVMLWLLRTLDYPIFGGHFLILLSLTVGITVVIASASWFLVERPVLRLTAGTRSRRSVDTAASTPATSAPMHSS